MSAEQNNIGQANEIFAKIEKMALSNLNVRTRKGISDLEKAFRSPNGSDFNGRECVKLTIDPEKVFTLDNGKVGVEVTPNEFFDALREQWVARWKDYQVGEETRRFMQSVKDSQEVFKRFMEYENRNDEPDF